MKTSIDIQLNVEGKEKKATIDGIDYLHSNYLLLELRGGRITRFIVGKGSPLTIRQRIAFWVAGGK